MIPVSSYLLVVVKDFWNSGVNYWEIWKDKLRLCLHKLDVRSEFRNFVWLVSFLVKIRMYYKSLK